MIKDFIVLYRVANSFPFFKREAIIDNDFRCYWLFHACFFFQTLKQAKFETKVSGWCAHVVAGNTGLIHTPDIAVTHTCPYS